MELDTEELLATKNRENECKCCEEIEFWRNQKSDVVEYKLFAKLSQYGWEIGERKIKGKQISTITSRAFDINYCPMCGRKLV